MRRFDDHRRILYLLASLGVGLSLFLAGSLLLQSATKAARPASPEATTFSVSPTSGAADTTVQFSGCNWAKGETVEIYFDDPALKMTTALVKLGGGCFEADATIPHEAEPGEHIINAVGDMGNSDALTFTVTAAELFLTPSKGPANSTIQASGGGWNTNADIEVLWSDGSTVIGSGQTDDQGDFIVGVTIPASAAVGVHALTAQDAGGTSTSTNFEVTAPALDLVPDDGPPQSTVTASGCGWRPGETVSMAWETTGNTLTTVEDHDEDGCVGVYITVPSGAAYGDRTVYGIGDSTGATAQATFTVRDPDFQFYPSSGPVESRVAAQGCGWVGNAQVSVEWSDGEVMTTTDVRQNGCFDADVTVPLDAAVGAHEATAVGSASGVATATFTVSDTATIDIFPNPQGSGDEVRVHGLGWIQGELVTVNWPTGALLGFEEPPPSGEISFDARIPRDARMGAYTVTASGSSGSEAKELFRVENDTELAMVDAPAGATVDACLEDWAHGEEITIRWPTGGIVGSATYSWTSELCGFRTPVHIPSGAALGTYTVTARGDKGGYDEEAFTVKADTIDPTAWIYLYPDAIPTDETATLVGWGSDDVAVRKIDLLVDGTIERTCTAPFSGDDETRTCEETGLSLSEGLHTMEVRVYDLEDNVDAASARLAAYEPGEPPSVRISYWPENPGDGQPVRITARAEDDQGGIETLLIYVNEDGPAYLGEDYDFHYDPPYANQVSETVVFTPTSGKHVLNYEALAFDPGGLSDRTRELTILVANDPPDSDGDDVSDAHENILCTDPHDPDSDHDGLRDDWEIQGLRFVDGDVVSLPRMGANPCSKDIFLQYDYEQGTRIPNISLQNVVNVFRDHQVQLHLETNQRPHSGTSSRMTSTLKADTASYAKDGDGDYFFEPKRNWTHYYAYSHHRAGASSTWNHVTIAYHGPNWNCPPSVPNPQTNPRCQQSGHSRGQLQYLLTHELGHDLGLGHGGRDGGDQQKSNGELVYYQGSWNDENRKPNYRSVMNYRYNRGNLCYNPSNNRFIGRFEFQTQGLPTLDENDLDERPDSAFATALRSLSCGNPNQVSVIAYTCTDPDEQDSKGNDITYQMLTDGQQTLARKSEQTNGFTTTVPSHPNGIDWNCDGKIESSVSENINGGGGKGTLTSRQDWPLIPSGHSCVLGKDERINAIGYPSSYVDDTLAPPCPPPGARTFILGGGILAPSSPQQMEPEEPHIDVEEEEATLDGLPNFETCDGEDNDGDGQIDEGCPDADGDGLADEVDNCPLVANADQADFDSDFRGNACEGRPGAPRNVEAEETAQGVVLSWDAPAAGHPIGYNVYRRLAGDVSFHHLGGYPSTEVISYTDASGVTAGGEHVYMVRALNRYAEEGDASPTVTVVIPQPHKLYLPAVMRSQ